MQRAEKLSPPIAAKMPVDRFFGYGLESLGQTRASNSPGDASICKDRDVDGPGRADTS